MFLKKEDNYLNFDEYIFMIKYNIIFSNIY